MKNEVTIRRGESSDLPYLYDICLRTGDNGKDASPLYRDPFLVGQYFAAPYLFFPGGIVFIAEEDLRPKGYILAVPDTREFNRWMEAEWLPPLRRRHPLPGAADRPPWSGAAGSALELWLISQIQKPHLPPTGKTALLLDSYPAHLHIDLLPDIQGKGWGRSLMGTLFGELRRQGIPGLHLGVSAENTGAILFYGKMGFTVLEEETGGKTLGKKL
ncbi:MAG: GNAT family N-acetyltransferase [Spirochaetaceae bacterium]|jgi:ribosomal protein S18 acetylase RimI-like enzyme|nr:GNAT family N-acetyltransferase [Spirochaetaceae bacterium]